MLPRSAIRSRNCAHPVSRRFAARVLLDRDTGEILRWQSQPQTGQRAAEERRTSCQLRERAKGDLGRPVVLVPGQGILGCRLFRKGGCVVTSDWPNLKRNELCNQQRHALAAPVRDTGALRFCSHLCSPSILATHSIQHHLLAPIWPSGGCDPRRGVGIRRVVRRNADSGVHAVGHNCGLPCWREADPGCRGAASATSRGRFGRSRA